MNDFVITESTKAEADLVNNCLVDYNFSKVPPTRDPYFVPINRVIKGKNGDVLGGINSMIIGWDSLHIDIMWVKEACRTAGYGSMLIKEVERAAMDNGCKLIHLETYDFQARDFYLKHGYEIFGVLEGSPLGHKVYYMKKNI